MRMPAIFPHQLVPAASRRHSSWLQHLFGWLQPRPHRAPAVKIGFAAALPALSGGQDYLLLAEWLRAEDELEGRAAASPKTT